MTTTTTTTYQTFFSLPQTPFQKGTCDGELYRPINTARVLEQIRTALHQRQQIALYGEPGVGKTCLVRILRHDLPRTSFV